MINGDIPAKCIQMAMVLYVNDNALFFHEEVFRFQVSHVNSVFLFAIVDKSRR